MHGTPTFLLLLGQRNGTTEDGKSLQNLRWLIVWGHKS